LKTRTSFFKNVYWALLLFIFGVNLVYKLGLAGTLAPDQGGFERNVIWGIQQVIAGNPFYQNPEAEPFAIIQYMPFYYYLIGLTGKGLGVDPVQAEQVYLLARTFNLVITLLAAGLLSLMAIRIFKVSKSIGIGAGVIAFCLMDRFAISGRPDALKFFLFQCLVFVLIQFPEKRKKWVYSLALILGLLAFLSKQDGLVFSGILPLALLIQRQWKDLILVVLAQFGLLLVSQLAFQFIWEGQFLANTAGGLQNGLSVSWFLQSFNQFFSLHALLFGLAMVLAYEFLQEKNWKLLVLGAAFVCAFFPPLLLVYKYGSSANYFSEAIFISLLIVAIGLNQFKNLAFFTREESKWLMASVFSGLLFYTQMMTWGLSIFFNREDLVKQNFEIQKSISLEIREKSGINEKVLILTKRQWEDHFTTMLFDKVACPQRDVSLQVFDAKGKIDFQTFYQSIKSGNVRWLVADEGANPSFLKGDFSGFTPAFSRNGFTVWNRN
jgi:hypothetical protein